MRPNSISDMYAGTFDNALVLLAFHLPVPQVHWVLVSMCLFRWRI